MEQTIKNGGLPGMTDKVLDKTNKKEYAKMEPSKERKIIDALIMLERIKGTLQEVLKT